MNLNGSAVLPNFHYKLYLGLETLYKKDRRYSDPKACNGQKIIGQNIRQKIRQKFRQKISSKNFVKKFRQKISSKNSSKKFIKKFVKKFVKKICQKNSSKHLSKKFVKNFTIGIHTSRKLKKALLRKKGKSQTNKQTNTTRFLEASLVRKRQQA
jgi:hypothetical protein